MRTKVVHIALLLMILCSLTIPMSGQDYPWIANKNYLAEFKGHYGFFYHHHFEMERNTPPSRPRSTKRPSARRNGRRSITSP